MRNDTITAEPISVDWQEAFTQGAYDSRSDTDGTRAALVYPAVSALDFEEVETLGEAFGVNTDAEEGEEQDDYEERIRNEVEEAIQDEPYQLEPMMNYAYPLPGWRDDPEAFQSDIITNTSCCIVMLDDEPVLALTGGGMDLSWDICKAYTILGLLPPLHFARNLPRMAGMSHKANRETLEACKKTAQIAALWAKNAVEDLDRVESWLKEQDAKKVSA